MALTVSNVKVGVPDSNRSSPYWHSTLTVALDNTQSSVVVVTIYDTSATDGVVSAVKAGSGGTDYTLATQYYDATCNGHVSIWYLTGPQLSAFVYVYFGGTVTDIVAAEFRIDAIVEVDAIATPATGNGSPTITWSTVATDTVAVSAALSDQATSTNITSNDTSVYIEDFGTDTGLAAYAVRTSSGSQTIDWTDTDNDEDWVAVGASFKEKFGLQLTPSPASTRVSTLQGGQGLAPPPASVVAKVIAPTVSIPVGEIFHIDVEEGDATDYTGASGGISINGTSPLFGSYDIQVDVSSGDTADDYFYKTFSVLSTAQYLSIRFYVNLDSITIPTDGQSLRVIQGRTSGTPSSYFYWGIRNTAGTRQYYLTLTDDTSSDQSGAYVDALTGDVCIEVRMVRESYDGANDGYAEYWINGSKQPNRTNWSQNWNVIGNSIQFDMGNNARSAAAVSGTLWMDEIIMRDDGLYIGEIETGVSITPPAASCVVDTKLKVIKAYAEDAGFTPTLLDNFTGTDGDPPSAPWVPLDVPESTYYGVINTNQVVPISTYFRGLYGVVWDSNQTMEMSVLTNFNSTTRNFLIGFAQIPASVRGYDFWQDNMNYYYLQVTHNNSTDALTLYLYKGWGDGTYQINFQNYTVTNLEGVGLRRQPDGLFEIFIKRTGVTNWYHVHSVYDYDVQDPTQISVTTPFIAGVNSDGYYDDFSGSGTYQGTIAQRVTVVPSTVLGSISTPVTVTPSSASAVVSSIAPDVYTPLEITPSPASAVVSALQGGQAIAPFPAQVIADTQDPTVYTPLQITPQPASTVVDSVDPEVSTPLLVSTTPASVIADTATPDIYTPLTITPSSASTIADTQNPDVYNPLSVTPSSASVVADVVSPDVYTPLTISTSAASSIVDTVAPSVYTPLTVTPSASSVIVDTVSPSVYTPVTITPSASSTVVDTVDPTVSTATLITPSPAYAVASTVDPSVYNPLTVTPATASVVADTVAPDVLESVYITPSSASVIVGKADPTVYTPFEYTPQTSSVVAGVVAPQVEEAVYIYPTPSYVVVRVVQPQVIEPVEITPDTASVVVGVAPPDVIEAVYITPTPTSTIVDVTNPTVYTPLVLSAVVSVITDTVTPSVYTPLAISPTEATAVVSTVAPSVYTPLEITVAGSSVVVGVVDPTVIESVYISPSFASAISSTVDPTYYTEENITPTPASCVASTQLTFVANAVRIFEFGTAEGWAFTRTQGTSLEGAVQNDRMESYTSDPAADDIGYWEWTGTLNQLFNVSETTLVDLYTIMTEGVNVFISVDNNQIGPLDLDAIELIASRIATGTGEVTSEDILLGQSLDMSASRSIKLTVQVRTAP